MRTFERTNSGARPSVFTPQEFVQQQLQLDPLLRVDRFRSLEDYVLHLMHEFTYEEAAHYAAGRHVLDLGCNDGRGTAKLAETAASVLGVDVSESAIADARRRFPAFDFRVVDGMFLPFDDASFDLVVCMHVIECIVDQRLFLADIHRVLRPNGIAVFATPNAKSRLDPGMPPWDSSHVHEYAAAELAEQLGERFARAKVLGLFADEPLLSIERNRVYRARARARELLARSVKDPSEDARLRVRRRVKSMLPELVVAAFRNLGAWLRKPRSRRPPATALEKCASAQLFFRETGLDGALDLLAVCRK